MSVILPLVSAHHEMLTLADPLARLGGVRLVYHSPCDSVLRTGDDTVSAENVLPGFQIAANEVFRRAGID